MKTLVLGASADPGKTAHMATRRLLDKGYETYPVGRTPGIISGVDILTNQPHIEDIHTITLYLRKERQTDLYQYIFSLNPQRIIFNPGAENYELKRLAEQKGIQAINACTLVMLSLDNYSE